VTETVLMTLTPDVTGWLLKKSGCGGKCSSSYSLLVLDSGTRGIEGPPPPRRAAPANGINHADNHRTSVRSMNHDSIRCGGCLRE